MTKTAPIAIKIGDRPQLNIPIFCFGGTRELRDRARLARADRYFERAEIVDKMLLFCEQYRW